ncbi:MAG: hypothetical protein EXQ77_04685 [Thermoleophilia bacterium]|nr:hypothetical protein [Thermoleophilia bacterium]
MDAVLLALGSAFLFGAMTVALRVALGRGIDAVAGTLATVLVALAVAVTATVLRGGVELDGLWPFIVAGFLAPGLSQTLFTFAVRDVGASRTSAAAGTAPLFAVLLALLVLNEPPMEWVMTGAILIVMGGLALASERGRPQHLKAVGLLFALAAAFVFATRDALVRHLSLDTPVTPQLGVTVTLATGAVVTVGWLLLTGRRPSLRAFPWFAPAGVLFGLSYLCLFEAFYRGRLSVVAPLVATEALWGVLLSAVFLRRHEVVGRRLVVGAALVVVGGMLIAAFR